MSYVNLSHPLNNEYEKMLGFLGIPYDSGSGNIKGAFFAPDTLRNIFHKPPLITRDGIDVSNVVINDLGNVKVYSDNWENTYHEIKRTITEIISKYNFPLLTIGGDHSITYATVSSFAEKKNWVLYGLIHIRIHWMSILIQDILMVLL